MSMPGIKRYTFETAEQWKSGASRHLGFEPGAVTASARYRAIQIKETSHKDRTRAFTYEFCADLAWVRRNFKLMRNSSAGLREVERLSVGRAARTWKPSALASGKLYFWLLIRRRGTPTETRIYRYNNVGQGRRRVDVVRRPVLAMCTDRQDGVWVVLGGDNENATVVRIGADGAVGEQLSIDARLKRAAITATCDGKRLVVLDYAPQITECDPQKSWRLWSLDLCDRTPEGRKNTAFRVIYSLPRRDGVCHTDAPLFRPQLLAIDCADVIHVVSRKDGQLWSLDISGFVIRQHAETLDRCDLPIVGIAANHELAVSARRGVFRLRPTMVAEATTGDYQPTYITPTMTSPDGEVTGWSRADIDMNLPAGVTVEVDVATSSDPVVASQVNQILADDTTPRAAQLAQLEARLTWNESYSRRFQAGDDQVSSVHVPLHGVTDTFVWLRIRVFAESGAQVPVIRAMRVYYPNISYIEYLPAVYRADKTSAHFLRSFLAIFETLFGNLDAELAALPEKIDPATAPNDWLPYLLRWLGLPPATELSTGAQRELLKAAPDLLRARGTQSALEALLRIVVGDAFEVIDSGTQASPWVLPSSCRPGIGSRLGNGTLILGNKRPAFRLGSTSRLNKRRLGFQKTDSAALFLRRHAVIQVRVAAARDNRDELRDLLDRYLPYFIPAHCRYSLQFVDPAQIRGHGRLDDDLRLANLAPRRLGDASIIGTLPLGSARPDHPAGDNGFLDVDLILS